METRKVYVSGGSTYVISLPKKWAKKTNLKAGDSIAVTEQDSSLLIETRVTEKELSVKEIRISQVASSDALARIIIALYLTGYDTIKIRLDRKDNLRYREAIRETLDYLMGIEIVDDTHDSMTLEIMVDHKRMMTSQVLQKMFSMDRSMLLDTGKALRNRDTGLARDAIAREREVDRLYFLVVRQLKSAVRYQQVAEKLGITNQRDCLGYRILVKALERIADHIENIAKNYIRLAELRKQPKLHGYTGLVNDIAVIFESSFDALAARDGESAEKVFRELKDIREHYSDISKELFKIDDIQSAIIQKSMLDSLWRIASYSGDIAEIAINMSTEVP